MQLIYLESCNPNTLKMEQGFLSPKMGSSDRAIPNQLRQQLLSRRSRNVLTGGDAVPFNFLPFGTIHQRQKKLQSCHVLLSCVVRLRSHLGGRKEQNEQNERASREGGGGKVLRQKGHCDKVREAGWGGEKAGKVRDISQTRDPFPRGPWSQNLSPGTSFPFVLLIKCQGCV